VALPVVSGRKVVKALTKAGFRVAGRRGSHIKLKKKVDGKAFVVIVPVGVHAHQASIRCREG
jgi:predicted RNA binding protein YcfA (HicA-like mRNA interferase family)